jgi:polyisoprenoid-binding protein YceI
MRYAIDAANSEIDWSGFMPGTSISGQVHFDNGIIETGRNNEITGGTLTVDMSSIETLDSQLNDAGRKQLTENLKSENFFNTEIYPAAEFRLLEVQAIGDRADSCNADGLIQPTHEVKGELTLNGITHKVAALVNLQIQGRKMLVQTMFTLDRTLWGMDHLMVPEEGQGKVLPDMEIMVKVVAEALEEPLACAA